MKYKTSIRLTPDAKRLLESLSAKLGISQASVLELAIRTMAKSESLK